MIGRGRNRPRLGTVDRSSEHNFTIEATTSLTDIAIGIWSPPLLPTSQVSLVLKIHPSTPFQLMLQEQ